MANVRLTFVLLLQCILLNSIICGNDFNENLDEFYRPQIHSLVNYLNQDRNRIYNYNYATLISAQNKDPDSIDLIINVELECRKPELCITDKVTCQGTVRYNEETATYETLQGAICQPKIRIDLTKDENVPTELDSSTPQTAKIAEIQQAVELTHEVGSAGDVSGEQFIAVRPNSEYCLGCPVNINTNVEGLDVLTDVALQHIESERENKVALIRILGIQQQVVAGIKYTLLLEIAPSICPKTVEATYLKSCVADSNSESQICQITYYQQPWISKNKNIIANNCTHSQEFTVTVKPNLSTEKPNVSNDMDNEIDINYDYKKPVDGSEMGIMSISRMREVESQIIYKNPAETEPVATTEGGLSDTQKAALEDFLDMMGDAPIQKRAVKDNDNNNDDSSSSSSSSDEEKEKKITQTEAPKHHGNNDNNDSSSSSSNSSVDDNNNNNKRDKKKSKRNVSNQNKSSESVESSEELTTTMVNKKGDKLTGASPISVPKEINSQKVKNQYSEESLEDSSEEQKGGVRKRRSVHSELVKISPDEKTFVHNLASIAVNELDDIDSDNHKRLVLQVLGAKKMFTDGIIYHMTLRVGVSRCAEEQGTITDLMKSYPKDGCRDKLFENLTKICKVQVYVTKEKTNPKVLKSHCQDMKKDFSDANRTFRLKRGGGAAMPGGVNQVDPKDAKIQQYATTLLIQLGEQNGGNKKQELVQVISASKQVVAGLLYKLKLEIKIGDQSRICEYEVWERAWLEISKDVKEKCDGDTEKKQYRFKRSVPIQYLGKDDHNIHIGLFKKFTQKFDKKYKNKSEFKKRFNIFRDNMKLVKRLTENEQGTAKYGASVFADLTYKEFKQHMGLRPELRSVNHISYPKADIPDIDIPVEFDWRKKGVISEVKNQGSCGSCWAFSVTGNIEGLNAIKTGKMIELSEQELVDCDAMDNGCGGGYMDNAYRAIEQLGGLETETDYPYEAENEKCHFNKSLTKVQITGAVNISSDEQDMAKWLVKNGPISIGINANAMQFYMGGISHPWKVLCDSTNLDHGVLLVGYGVHKYPLFNKTLPFWIIKNSWGPSWGEQGYYRVFRGDGTCGVNLMAESATLD